MVIQSTSNKKIKKLRSLYRDRKNRYFYGEYVAEGTIICNDLPDDIITCVYVKESAVSLSEKFDPEKTVFVKDEIFDAVADTKTPSGVIATVKMLESKPICGDMVILLCGLSDAGNVGTIIRTACARGVNTVICAETADPYSPKAVRASMGGITKVNIIQTDLERALLSLKDFKLAALDMDGICIYDYQKDGKIVLAVGNEAHGVPDIVRNSCDVKLSIPMQKNGVESLNAAVSASIAMYLIN